MGFDGVARIACHVVNLSDINFKFYNSMLWNGAIDEQHSSKCIMNLKVRSISL